MEELKEVELVDTKKETEAELANSNVVIDDDYIPIIDISPYDTYQLIMELYRQLEIEPLLQEVINFYKFTNENKILQLSQFRDYYVSETFTTLSIHCDGDTFLYSVMILRNIITSANPTDFEIVIPPMMNPELFQKLHFKYFNFDDVHEKRILVDFLINFNGFSETSRDFTCNFFQMDEITADIVNSEDELQKLSISFLLSFLFYRLTDEALFNTMVFVSEGIDQVQPTNKLALLGIVLEILKQNAEIAITCPNFSTIAKLVENLDQCPIKQCLRFYKYLIRSNLVGIDPPLFLMRLIREEDLKVQNKVVKIITAFIDKNSDSFQMMCRQGLLDDVADIFANGNFNQKLNCCKILRKGFDVTDKDFIYYFLATKSKDGEKSLIASLTDLLSPDMHKESLIILEIFSIIFSSYICDEAMAFAVHEFLENEGDSKFDDIIMETEDEELSQRAEAIKDIIINFDGTDVDPEYNWERLGNYFLTSGESDDSYESMEEEEEMEYIRQLEHDEEERKGRYYD